MEAFWPLALRRAWRLSLSGWRTRRPASARLGSEPWAPQVVARRRAARRWLAGPRHVKPPRRSDRVRWSWRRHRKLSAPRRQPWRRLPACRRCLRLARRGLALRPAWRLRRCSQPDLAMALGRSAGCSRAATPRRAGASQRRCLSRQAGAQAAHTMRRRRPVNRICRTDPLERVEVLQWERNSSRPIEYAGPRSPLQGHGGF